MYIKLRLFISLSLIASLFSCSFIDLRGLEITVIPAEAYGILGEDETISLTFSPSVDEETFENIFDLTGVTGNEDGDFEWIDADTDSAQTVIFYPNDKLQPGFQYQLKISGEITARDGRTFVKKISIPFYYLTDQLPPGLEAVSLAPAEIADVTTPLILTFSKPIDQYSFNDGFRLSPATEWTSEWNTTADQVIIRPNEKWVNLQYYQWNLTTEITDNDGVPLPGEYEGSFLVQIDTAPPVLLSLYPAADNYNGSFTLKSLLSADDLLINEHLTLGFNEPIDMNTLRLNLCFNPSIEGYLTAVSANTILYYIYEDIPPGTTYELIIREGLDDSSGNSTESEITRIFTPSVPVQRITSIEIEDENGIFLTVTEIDFNTPSFLDTTGLDYFGSDGIHFVVNISEGYPEYSVNERLAFEESVNLTPVFPPGIFPPSLQLKSWDTDNSLRLIYKNLVGCSADEPVYYEFKITAGSTDSANPAGSYLTDSVFFRMLAEVN